MFIDNLPSDEFSIRKMIVEAKKLILEYEIRFFEEEDSDKEEQLKSSTSVKHHEKALQTFRSATSLKQYWCIPLSVDVRTFNFTKLIQKQLSLSGGRPFDVITVDPPWQLSTANPTRGVAISYDTLSDAEILKIPFDLLQPKQGFLFVWVINAKYRFALEMMATFGYKLVDEICWVKQTVNGKIAKGHGYYLQHAKELCLVGFKGDVESMALRVRDSAPM